MNNDNFVVRVILNQVNKMYSLNVLKNRFTDLLKLHFFEYGILSFASLYNQIRTKTSIRYAKENDREKRERRRERKVEGEI